MNDYVEDSKTKIRVHQRREAKIDYTLVKTTENDRRRSMRSSRKLSGFELVEE